jgi:hypothetical protein
MRESAIREEKLFFKFLALAKSGEFYFHVLFRFFNAQKKTRKQEPTAGR